MLAHDQAGDGDAVVLLHAGIADRTMWREHLDWLAEAGYHALAVDLPGFGETPVEPGPQAPREDVLRTLNEFDIAPAALVGNSFGAAVALRVAAVAPTAVSALALISPPPLDQEPSPVLGEAWEAEETALERGDIDGAIEAVVDAWTLPGAPAALRERVAAMQRRAFELQQAAGEHDMPDFKRGAGELATALPRGRYAVIEGAGHLAPLETPAAFRELLLTFLKRG